MAALTHITFLRHGRARHNEDFEIRGEHAYFDGANIDAELTKKGVAQAIQLQGRLHREDFDAIFLFAPSALSPDSPACDARVQILPCYFGRPADGATR